MIINNDNNNDEMINVWEEYYNSIPQTAPVHDGVTHIHTIIDNIHLGLDLLEERITSVIQALVEAHNELLLKLYQIEKQLEKGEPIKKESIATNNSGELYQELKKTYQEIAELRARLKEIKGDKENDI